MPILADLTSPSPAFVLIAGAALLLVLIVQPALQRIGVSVVVGYILIGIIVGRVQDASGLLDGPGLSAFSALGEIGVTALLFRVGLDSKLAHLFKQLRLAIPLWLSNVLVSGGAGFAVAYWLLGCELVPSLVVGVALSATSVGITVAVWKEAGKLGTPIGNLTLDVAELDDLSAVFLLGMMLAIAAPLAGGETDSLLDTAAAAMGDYTLRLLGFAVLCVLLARVEPHATAWVRNHVPTRSGIVVYIVASALAVAGTAGLVGLPVPVGAFFAGLVFSRDPAAIRYEASFQPLYAFFVPFFFIHIGMLVDPAVALAAAGTGLALAAAAIVGKIAGALPAAFVRPLPDAMLLGVSLVPRAEICMVIVQLGREQGEWMVPAEIYAAMVTVVLVTGLVAPLILRARLRGLAGPPSHGTEPDEREEPTLSDEATMVRLRRERREDGISH